MPTLLEALLLGALQGATEWLPVSSSGHLVLAQELLAVDVPAAFDVALHLGTLLPVLWIFRKEIASVLKALLTFDRAGDDFMLGLLLILATITTGTVGILFLDFFESLFQSAAAVGIGLLITAAFLATSKFFSGKKKVGAKDSVLIGLAQALAIVPGISRSGATISTGLIRGVDKRRAFSFSFLLSVPAILGAQLFELPKLSFAGIDPLVMLTGILTAAIIGYISIRLLEKLVLTERFHWFAPYCFALGALILYII